MRISQSYGVYVTAVENISPNVQPFPYGCCQFTLKATRSGLVQNSLTPRRPTCRAVTLKCRYIKLDWCLILLCSDGVVCRVVSCSSCYLTAVTGGSTPDLLRCLQSEQSELTSIVLPGRHPLPQEFHVLLLLVGFPLPEYPERTSLQLLLCQCTKINLGTKISSYLRGDNLSPFSVGFRIYLRTQTAL